MGRPWTQRPEPTAEETAGPGIQGIRSIRLEGTDAGARIRTWELLREQILSLPPLAARPPRRHPGEEMRTLFVFRFFVCQIGLVDDRHREGPFFTTSLRQARFG